MYRLVIPSLAALGNFDRKCEAKAKIIAFVKPR
jgi:hypothetical protein